MGLLPDFTNYVAGTPADPSIVSADIARLYSLLGTATSAATFSDANIYTNAAINPAKISGTALTLTASALQVVLTEKLASSLGSTALVYTGGTLKIDTTSTSSNGAADLITYTLPQNTLTTTGRGLRIKAWGIKTASANAATVQMQIGGNVLISKILSATAGVSDVWELEAIFIRTGLNAQLGYGKGVHTGATGQAAPPDVAANYSFQQQGTYALTETASAVIKVNASVATLAEVTQKGLLIEAI